MRISTMIVGLVLWAGLLLAAVQPEASVAVAHRLVQAKTDSQPALPDDLGGQQRGGNAGQAGNAGHTIDWQGLQDLPLPPEIVVHVADFPCAPCDQLKRNLAGLDQVRVTYRTGGESAYPALKYAGRTWYGALSAAQVAAIVRDYTPQGTIPQAFGDVTLGQLSRRQIGLDQGVISLGGGKIVVPKGQIVTFEPGVTAGNGIVSVTITRAELQDDKVLLSAKNFPMRLVLSLGP